jgi:hypothetical protein
MKKILVVLLVFAVAGGVFAQQGEWGINGHVNLNTKVDFSGDAALVGAGDYFDNEGVLGVSYTRDALKASLDFKVNLTGDAMFKGMEEGSIKGTMEYSGDNYHFKASAPMKFLLLSGTNITGTGGIDDLWGYYKLLGGMVHLEAAYKGNSGDFWRSDDTSGGGWAKADNGILTNVTIEALQFGISVPKLFALNPGVELIDGALLKSTIGLKFDMSPIEFAVNFGFEDYRVYFGGLLKLVPDVLTFGLSFNGTFKDPDGSAPKATAGAKVDYSAGVMGAALKVLYDVLPSDNAGFAIKPSFWYNVLPDYLRFSVEAGLFFYNDSVNWSVQPELTWNFLGTGAKGIGDINTGMGFRYVLNSKDEVNKFYAGFKWGF